MIQGNRYDGYANIATGLKFIQSKGVGKEKTCNLFISWRLPCIYSEISSSLLNWHLLSCILWTSLHHVVLIRLFDLSHVVSVVCAVTTCHISHVPFLCSSPRVSNWKLECCHITFFFQVGSFQVTYWNELHQLNVSWSLGLYLKWLTFEQVRWPCSWMLHFNIWCSVVKYFKIVCNMTWPDLTWRDVIEVTGTIVKSKQFECGKIFSHVDWCVFIKVAYSP
jgi:hypothetical protein